jgi:hypothetical protein
MNKLIHISNFKNRAFNWLWSKRIYIIHFTFFILCILIFRELLGPSEEIIRLDTPILFPDSTIHIHASDILVHNSAIRTMLHENMAMDVSSMTARENVKMQTRNFYVVILVAFLSFLLGKRNSQYKQKYVEIILLFFITAIYTLEIINKDIDNYTNASFYIKGSAVQKLLNSNIDDTTWFNVSPKSLNSKWDEADQIPKRWFRKLQTAFYPSGDQILFYVAPFFVIYFRILSRRLNRNSNRQPVNE